MSKTTKNGGCYQVRFTTVVDRPWFRDATFAPVGTGTRIPTTIEAKSHGAAARIFAAIMAGQDDYLSEYVCRVEVIQMRANRSPRIVRRAVSRLRGPDRDSNRALRIAALACHAQRQGRAMTLVHADWATSAA